MTTAAQIAPTIIPVAAGSDLSSKQHYFMDVVAGVLAVAGAGTRVAGVLTNDPDAAGKPGSLQIAGVAIVLAGGSITAGGGVASSAAGKAVAASGSAFVCGIALTSAEDGEYVGVLLTGASAVGLAAMSEAISTAGALNPAVPLTELSVTGTVAYTLADGTYVGQKKAILCTAAASTPLGTVTIATMSGSRTNVAYVFSTVGARLELEWTSGGWRETAIRPAGVDTPTGATTLNPLVLLHAITIADTIDWVLPSGTVPGQMQKILAAANSGTPAGTISGLFYDESDASADATDINMNAAGDAATVVWDGARWFAIELVSATVS